MARRRRTRQPNPPSTRAANKSEHRAEKITLRRIWNFLWYEDSLASWIANIVLAYVLIKFILYPGLGLILGTPFPVVAVVSGSMEHHPSNFDDWWAAHGAFYEQEPWNISREQFETFPFKNGFNKGDIMVLTGVDPDSMPIGTVIVYKSAKPYPIIHRYIGTNEVPLRGEYLVSKGDNNRLIFAGPELNEFRVPKDWVFGKATFRIPYLGYVKLWAVDAFNWLLSLFS